jgi:hypothetical protein
VDGFDPFEADPHELPFEGCGFFVVVVVVVVVEVEVELDPVVPDPLPRPFEYVEYIPGLPCDAGCPDVDV